MIVNLLVVARMLKGMKFYAALYCRRWDRLENREVSKLFLDDV